MFNQSLLAPLDRVNHWKDAPASCYTYLIQLDGCYTGIFKANVQYPHGIPTGIVHHNGNKDAYYFRCNGGHEFADRASPNMIPLHFGKYHKSFIKAIVEFFPDFPSDCTWGATLHSVYCLTDKLEESSYKGPLDHFPECV